jgi:hypothetical protein
MTYETTQCYRCKHFKLFHTCEAFEDIPIAIFINKFDHHKPYKGDHGIQFELKISAVKAAGFPLKGGPGSGNFGHEGRPDEVGGSGAGVGAATGNVNENQRAVAGTLYSHAVERAERTTAQINGIATTTGGETAHLEFAVKSENSTARKIADIQKDNPNLTAKEAALRVTDSLRYTIIYDDQNFVSNFSQSEAMLTAEGYERYDTKQANYFGSKEYGYQGYNTVWQDAQGNTIELQYHTIDSLRIKDEVTKDYQKFRLAKNPETKAFILQKMNDKWEDFVPPKNYNELPGVKKP